MTSVALFVHPLNLGKRDVMAALSAMRRASSAPALRLHSGAIRRHASGKAGAQSVAVIGAGITGVTTARALAERVRRHDAQTMVCQKG